MNLSNPDTNWAKESILISEDPRVSMHASGIHLRWEKVPCSEHFRGVPHSEHMLQGIARPPTV